jgi:hypothetical protein
MSGSKPFRLFVLSLFVVIGFAAYAPIANNFFLSDDFAQIGKVLEGDLSVTWGHSHGGFFRPLFILSYFLDAQIWGRQPLGFHLTNIAVHVACSWLVVLLGLSLMHSPQFTFPQQKAVALFGGLIFLLHPSHTEAVSWISGRADLLATLFGLGALLVLIEYLRSRRRLLLASSLLLFVLALLSKESAICLPLAVFLITLYFDGSSGFSVALKRAAGYAAPFMIVLGLYMSARAFALGTIIGGYGTEQHLKFGHGIVISQLLRFFLRALFPAVFLHWFPFLESRRVSPVLIIVFALVLIVVVITLRRGSRRRAAIAQFRRHTLFWLLLAIGLCCLLPVINRRINLFDTQGERYLYLASAFSSISIAYILLVAGRSQMKIWILLICALLGFYAAMLLTTNQTWREASQLSRRILDGVGSLSTGERVLLLNAPDNLRGAYVYRNGLFEATKLFQDRKQIIDARAIAFHRVETLFDEVTVRTEDGTVELQLTNVAFETVDEKHSCARVLERSRGILRINLAECGGFDIFVINGGQVRKLTDSR